LDFLSYGQRLVLHIQEAQALITEPLTQHAIFLLQVVDDIKLLTVHPTGEDYDQVLQWYKALEISGAALPATPRLAASIEIKC
jgi:hypothetical protein